MKEQIIKILEEHISFKTGALTYGKVENKIMAYDNNKNTFLHIQIATSLEEAGYICWFSCEKVGDNVKAVLNINIERKI